MPRALWPIAALLALALAAPAAVGAAGQYSAVAQQRGVRLAAGDAMLRLTEVPLPAGGAPVTHSHSPGFTYAVVEPHALTVRGQRSLLAPGQAAWVGDGEEHTHARSGDAAGRFYFVSVSPDSLRGFVPPGISPSGIRESESVRLEAGVYDVVLAEARLPAAGDAVAPPAQAGPVALWLLEGQASVAGQALPASGTLLLAAGRNGAIANTGSAGARVLTLTLSPAAPAPAAPAQLPRTGSLDRSVLVVVGLGLAAVGWLAGRKRAGQGV
jgi:LPXTG-motif cell wall-anchored protein